MGCAKLLSTEETSTAINSIRGTLITLTDTTTAPNGAWSWFEDERAIIDDSDPANTLLLVSSVSNTFTGDDENGDIDLLWRNLDTGQQSEFELHNRLQDDDHDSAALIIRPDGKYVAMYATHGRDNLFRWRVSVNPHDPTAWTEEQTLANPNSGNVTYSNLHYLPDDNNGAGRMYNFNRSFNFDPNIMISNDLGATWSYAGKLLTQGDDRARPYLKYFSDGDKIHFTTTEEHPRDYDNSIYHGYVEDGKLYNSFGALVDANLFDLSAAAPSDLTPVFSTGTLFGGTVMQRAWTIDTAIDSAGLPVTVFSARAQDDAVDHRFFYSKFNGANWNTYEMAAAGSYLYSGEKDYTGLVSIDPDNPNIVYMSTDVDPRTGFNLEHYEIFRGKTEDGGATWDWMSITFFSTVDNLRPLVPKWNGEETALIWMRGNYFTYRNWDTEVVALTDITPLDVVSIADLNRN